MSKSKTKNSKYFPMKNYIYGILFIIILVLFIWYIASWKNVKNEEKLMNSYLMTTDTLTYEINDFDEIIQMQSEAPNNYFILISYTNDEGTYKLEKKLKKVIEDYDLKDLMYYLDVTDEKKDNNFLNNLNTTFKTDLIKNVPCILYFANNKLEKVIVDENKVFDYNSFINLLKDYEFEKAS